MRRSSFPPEPPEAAPEVPEAGSASRQRRARRRRLLAGAGSVIGHLAVLSFIMWTQPKPPQPEEPELMVALLDGPLLEMPSGAPPPAKPVVEPEPVEPQGIAREVEAPPVAEAPPPKKKEVKQPVVQPPKKVEEEAEERPEPPPEPSAAQLASATTAESGDGSGAGEGQGGGVGSGGGGGGRTCNLVRKLQNALRKDHLVQAAVASAHRGRPLWVWNGDWVRSQGEDGHGLAAVRQAIMWEVAFAPESCRAQPMRGLVLISLADSPGAARIAVGSSQWAWTDLLGARRR